MRGYFFTNLYLSSIQCGIQSAHCVHDLFIKYTYDADGYIPDGPTRVLYDWADHHKTMILLNGGYAVNLLRLYEFFNTMDNPYPFEKFHEEADSLNGACTSIGIILPEKIYNLSSELRDPHTRDTTLEDITETGKWWGPLPANGEEPGQIFEVSKFELELALELNNYKLAS